MESTITYSLGAFLEKLNLKGTAAINGTGNDLANKLAGNDAANVLSGRGVTTSCTGTGATIPDRRDGKDELWGGSGSDTFVFRLPDATSTDRVKDFSATDLDRDLRQRLRAEPGQRSGR